LAGAIGIEGGEVVGRVPGSERGFAFGVESEPWAGELDAEGEECVTGFLEETSGGRREGFVVLEEQVADPVLAEAFADSFEDAEFAAFDVEFGQTDRPGIREERIERPGLDLEGALLVRVADEASEAAIVDLVGSLEEADCAGGVGEGDGVDVNGRQAGMGAPGIDVRAELLHHGGVRFEGVDGAFGAGTGGQKAGHVADVGADVEDAVAGVNESANGLADREFEEAESVHLAADRVVQMDPDRETPRQDVVPLAGSGDRSAERAEQIGLWPEPEFRFPQGGQASHERASTGSGEVLGK